MYSDGPSGSYTIHDILDTIARLEQKTAARTFAEFEADWELRFRVERGIEIISEASRRLPAHLKASRPDIEWPSIAGIGSVLRHEYHTISNKIIWDVVQADLPSLKAAVEAMAAELNK